VCTLLNFIGFIKHKLIISEMLKSLTLLRESGPCVGFREAGKTFHSRHLKKEVRKAERRGEMEREKDLAACFLSPSPFVVGEGGNSSPFIFRTHSRGTYKNLIHPPLTPCQALSFSFLAHRATHVQGSV